MVSINENKPKKKNLFQNLFTFRHKFSDITQNIFFQPRMTKYNSDLYFPKGQTALGTLNNKSRENI